MTLQEKIDAISLQDCPKCGGAGILEEECRSGYNVTCYDCGSRTVTIDFKSEDGKLDAAERAAELWNLGKVITVHQGE